MEFKKEFLNQESYRFLKKEPCLGNHLLLLGYGGSHAYGTATPTSDIDIRGITRNTKKSLIGTEKFEQWEDTETDTVIYALTKAFNLLEACNPNMIEILGLRKEDYLYIDTYGELILKNKDMFLSKKAIYSFGGYATAQLYRIQNAFSRNSSSLKAKNQHILTIIQNSMRSFYERYQQNYKLDIHLDKNYQFLIDMETKDYPLQDAYGMLSEIRTIINQRDKLNHRNRKKDDTKLSKHACHLIRLLINGEEILRTGKINTYREKEHDLLMDIRNGKYQKEDHTFHSEFYELLKKYESKFEYAAKNTELPDKPDKARIEELLEAINLDTLGLQPECKTIIKTRKK